MKFATKRYDTTTSP